jgi:hypothetical protein
MSMGLFRTIPVDVDAIQFDGMNNEEPVFKDMGASVPSWLWKGITRGAVAFDSVGLKVNGHVVPAGAWIVHDGAFIDVMTNEKFERTFVPARKPLEKMLSAPKPINARKAEALQAVEPAPDVIPESVVVDGVPGFAPAPYPGASVVSINPVSQSVDEIDSIMNKIGA